MSKPLRLKTDAVPVTVPQTKDEVIEAIAAKFDVAYDAWVAATSS